MFAATEKIRKARKALKESAFAASDYGFIFLRVVLECACVDDVLFVLLLLNPPSTVGK